MVLLGYLYEDAGDDESAIRVLEAAVRTGHRYRSPGASVALGAIRMRRGAIALAAEDFRRAAQADEPGDSARAWILLGMALLELGDPSAAATAFREAQAIAPADLAAEATRLLEEIPAE